MAESRLLEAKPITGLMAGLRFAEFRSSDSPSVLRLDEQLHQAQIAVGDAERAIDPFLRLP